MSFIRNVPPARLRRAMCCRTAPPRPRARARWAWPPPRVGTRGRLGPRSADRAPPPRDRRPLRRRPPRPRAWGAPGGRRGRARRGGARGGGAGGRASAAGGEGVPGGWGDARAARFGGRQRGRSLQCGHAGVQHPGRVGTRHVACAGLPSECQYGQVVLWCTWCCGAMALLSSEPVAGSSRVNSMREPRAQRGGHRRVTARGHASVDMGAAVNGYV